MSAVAEFEGIRTDIPLRFYDATEESPNALASPDELDEFVLPLPIRTSVDDTLEISPVQRGSTSTSLLEKELSVAPLVRRRRRPAAKNTSEVLQQWEGVVTKVCSESFWGCLRDLTNPSNPLEIMELPLEEISDEDLKLLEPGSIFYWIIWNERSKKGSIRRISEFRVRRNPHWSKRDLEIAKKEGQQLFEQIKNGEE